MAKKCDNRGALYEQQCPPEDCKFIGEDGGCDLLFHEPDERKRMCLICRDYESKENDDDCGKAVNDDGQGECYKRI